MATVRTRIGPADNGRKMTLEEFWDAEGQPGYLYELARGVLEVTQVPGEPHYQVVHNLHEMLSEHGRLHPRLILRIGRGSDVQYIIPELDTDRNPGLAVVFREIPTRETSGGDACRSSGSRSSHPGAEPGSETTSTSGPITWPSGCSNTGSLTPMSERSRSLSAEKWMGSRAGKNGRSMARTSSSASCSPGSPARSANSGPTSTMRDERSTWIRDQVAPPGPGETIADDGADEVLVGASSRGKPRKTRLIRPRYPDNIVGSARFGTEGSVFGWGRSRTLALSSRGPRVHPGPPRIGFVFSRGSRGDWVCPGGLGVESFGFE